MASNTVVGLAVLVSLASEPKMREPVESLVGVPVSGVGLGLLATACGSLGFADAAVAAWPYFALQFEWLFSL